MARSCTRGAQAPPAPAAAAMSSSSSSSSWRALALPATYLSLRAVPSYPDAAEAHDLLCVLAAVTAPLCAARGWVVGILAESDRSAPGEGGTLVAGLNVNRGAKIELQLRSVANSRVFASTASLLDTLTHELAHCAHSDHGPGFHALWEALNADCEAALAAGATACPSAYGGGPRARAAHAALLELWRPKGFADMRDVRKRLHHVARGGVAVNDNSLFDEIGVARAPLPDGGTMAWFTAAGWPKSFDAIMIQTKYR